MSTPRLLRAILGLGLFACLGAPQPAGAFFGTGTDAFPGTLITVTNDSASGTDLTNFTMQAGEPGSGSHSAWWRFIAPANGRVVLRTVEAPGAIDGLANSPALSAYSGSAVNALSLIASNATSIFNAVPQISFPVNAAQEYHFRVSEGTGPVGFTSIIFRYFQYGARSYTGAINVGFGTAQQAYITLSLTAAGSYTGKIRSGGKEYPFSGQVGIDARTVVTMPNSLVTAPVDLTIDFANGTGPLPITLDNNANAVVSYLYPAATFTTAAPASVAGYYTAQLDTGSSGFIAGKITPTGKAMFAGTTGDGTKFTLAGPLSLVSNGVYALPFSAALFAGKGFITGGLRFIEGGIDLVDASGFQTRYLRPAGSTTFYPNGIFATFTVFGRIYTPAAVNQRALGFLNATNGAGKLMISMVANEIGAVTENLNLSVANKFTFASQMRMPQLVLNPKSGLVTGAISEPATVRRKLSGILVDGATPMLKGFVTGARANANFQVSP